jgi:hydroxymethylglutaryl-CoA reductase
MKNPNIITGFSRLDKFQKINLVSSYVSDSEDFQNTLLETFHRDPVIQKLYDEFSENTIGNYFFPFGVAPNFLINVHVTNGY